jgi:hypothetical protein
MPKLSPRARKEMVDLLVGIMEKRAEREDVRVAETAFSRPRGSAVRPAARAVPKGTPTAPANSSSVSASRSKARSASPLPERAAPVKTVRSPADVLFGDSKKVDR